MTDAPELQLVLRIRLDAQTGREHELPDRGAEAGEEGVEGLQFRSSEVYVSDFLPLNDDVLLWKPPSPDLSPSLLLQE